LRSRLHTSLAAALSLAALLGTATAQAQHYQEARAGNDYASGATADQDAGSAPMTVGYENASTTQAPATSSPDDAAHLAGAGAPSPDVPADAGTPSLSAAESSDLNPAPAPYGDPAAVSGAVASADYGNAPSSDYSRSELSGPTPSAPPAPSAPPPPPTPAPAPASPPLMTIEGVAATPGNQVQRTSLESQERWQIRNGERISVIFARWAQTVGWQTSWEPTDLVALADLELNDNFTGAITKVVNALNRGGADIQVRFYAANQMLRITARK